MFSDRSVRVALTLPKVEGNIKFDTQVQIQSSRSRIISINSKPQNSANRFHKHALTQIQTPKCIQLYTPMQESKRAKRLKNIPYQLKYFTPNLPNKNFKSSHLMSEDLLKHPSEAIDNQNKWQLKTHISRQNNVFSLCQFKRNEKQDKDIDQNSDRELLKKQNFINIENEKQKRYRKYKQATQKLIEQFSQNFNLKVKAECDYQ